MRASVTSLIDRRIYRAPPSGAITVKPAPEPSGGAALPSDEGSTEGDLAAEPATGKGTKDLKAHVEEHFLAKALPLSRVRARGDLALPLSRR